MAEDSQANVSIAEQNVLFFGAVALPLARMIYLGEVDPETVARDVVASKLHALGHTHEDAFEIHLTHVEEDMRLVSHCISENNPKSGIVLLFTLIEAEINSLIRILMRIRDFSASVITDTLKGTGFDTKINVVLPLLNANIPDRLRNAAIQCRSIRNVVVHNKATPALMADSGRKDSDSEIANQKSAAFFAENPIERLQADLKDFVDASISEDPAMQWSAYLFDKYFKIPG
ncbi:hypothetical protein [Roseateles cavernae]|uniref:hypothetical protein n=1 Tax=Roseateles cavernae TaxID=3153578 RepID=UPI0032E45B87